MPNHEIIVSKSGLPVNIDIYKTYDRLIPSHWHEHVEILFLYRGTLQIIRNDEKYTLREHDLFIVNSGDIHLTRSLGSVEVLILLIPLALFRSVITDDQIIRFREYFPKEELYHDTAFQEMLDHLHTLRILYEQEEDGYQFLFHSSVSLFLHTLYKNYVIDQGTEFFKTVRKQVRFKDIIDYVEANYKDPITIKKAASMAALNSEYFCRSFKKNTGSTFMEYVNMVRLTHIHRDLLDTEDSITHLQEQHGFTNNKVFLRMFKEIYGCTPSKLRAGKFTSSDCHT